MKSNFSTTIDFDGLCRVVHNAIGEIKRVNGEARQPSWEDAEGWQKQSTEDQISFHLDNPGAASDRSHNQWMANKIKQGYKYGPTVDNEAKTHNCLVSFEDLPPLQQLKDSIITVIVDTLAGNNK